MNSIGLFFTDGDLWMEQRRFVLRHLRDYGFARRFDPLEDEMNSEIGQFIDTLKNGPKYPHEKVSTKLCSFFFLSSTTQYFMLFVPPQKYISDGQIQLPVGLGSVFGNCFFKVMFSERLTREQSGLLFE